MKHCNTCNTDKPPKEFYKDNSSNDGLTSKCKQCQKEYQAKRYTPVKPTVKECKYCGQGFTAKHGTEYCSNKCRNRKHYEDKRFSIVCEGCGNKAEVTGKDVRYCSQECYHESYDFAHIKEYKCKVECETCGSEFEAGCAGAKYCSDECNPISWKYTNITFNTCEICRELFVNKKHNKLCCSDECYDIYNKQKSIKYKLEQHNEKYSDESNRPTCIVCNKTYFPEYGYKKRSYCSIECHDKHKKKLRKEAKYRRKALKRGAKRTQYINNEKVMKRDKYKCQLCGCSTPKKLRGSYEDNAPEIDHIIPLSKGGNHTYNNIQLLCRKCNLNKSDKYIGQQAIQFV